MGSTARAMRSRSCGANDSGADTVRAAKAISARVANNLADMNRVLGEKMARYWGAMGAFARSAHLLFSNRKLRIRNISRTVLNAVDT
jgi:hypothetical protein